MMELVGFPEMVRRSLSVGGIVVPAPANTEVAEAALREAIEQSTLEGPWLASARTPGGLEAIGKTLEELHAFGYDADRLAELADFHPVLARLAELDRGRQAILARLGRGSHTAQMRACYGETLDHDGQLEPMLVLAGNELYPERCRWLRWLTDQGGDVTVAVYHHPHNPAMFEPARVTVRLLGIDPEAVGTGNQMAHRLFATEATLDDGGTPISATRLVSSDPLAECEYVLRDIAKHPEREASIYARSISDYKQLLMAASKRIGVPIRLAAREEILANGFAQFVVEWLEWLAQEHPSHPAPWLGRVYAGLARTDQRRLRDRLRARILTPLSWSDWAEEAFPNSAERSPQDADAYWNPLFHWRARDLEPRTRADWTLWLRDQLRDLPNKEASAVVIDRDADAQNQMLRILFGHASVATLREETVSLAQFVSEAVQLWRSGQVSVRLGLNGVVVATNPDIIPRCDTLYVLGCTEGSFPGKRREDPVLIDSIRTLLNQRAPALAPLPTSYDLLRRERDDFYTVSASSKASVVYSYPFRRDESETSPSLFAEEAIAVSAHAESLSTVGYALGPPNPPFVCLADEAMAHARVPLAFSVDHELRTETRRRFATDRIDWTRKDLIRATQCPFRFQMQQHFACLRRREQDAWRSSLFQIDLAELRQTHGRDEATLLLQNRVENVLADPQTPVFPWERKLVRLGMRKIIEGWVDREFNSRQLWGREDVTTGQATIRFHEPPLRSRVEGKPFGGVLFSEKIPVYDEGGSIAIVSIYRASPPPKPKSFTAEDFIEIGSLFGLYYQRQRLAVEVESAQKTRTLIVPEKAFLTGNRPKTTAGLAVDSFEYSSEALKEFEMHQENAATVAFARRAMEAVQNALSVIQSGQINPTPGRHCQYCDYGELCRSHQDWGHRPATIRDAAEGAGPSA